MLPPASRRKAAREQSRRPASRRSRRFVPGRDKDAASGRAYHSARGCHDQPGLFPEPSGRLELTTSPSWCRSCRALRTSRCRPGAPADEIANADRQILRDSLTGCVAALGDPRGRAAVGGERIGYVLATTKHDYFTRTAHAHVEVLAVDAAAERRGIARALMGCGRGMARRRGYRWVTLNVFDTNARARALYDSLGYDRETIQYRKGLAAARHRSSPA